MPLLHDHNSNTTAYSDQDKAETLAACFSRTHGVSPNPLCLKNNIPQRAHNNLYHNERITPPPPITQNHFNLTPFLVTKTIRNLQNNEAPGPDKLTTQELKYLPKEAFAQIYYILKASIKLSYFPRSWKIAKIHPVPKPGKPITNPHSYTPISLLNTLSKVFEKYSSIIHQHLLTHLNEHNIIIPQQFGFREKHSCIQQLQRVTEFATIEVNKTRITQLILLDLEKAFDTYGTKCFSTICARYKAPNT